MLNQLAALAGWGLFILVGARPTAAPAAQAQTLGGGLRALLLALAIVICAALAAALWRGLPSSLALSIAGVITAAAIVASFAAALARGAFADAAPAGPLMRGLGFAVLLAGTIGVAIGCIQVWLPDWTDGDFIARTTIPGRAVANLRQPNHLASLLLWAATVAVIGFELASRERRPLARRAHAALLALMVFGIVLTASRTGTVGIVLLGVWGAIDRSLARGTRAALLGAPLGYALLWALLALSAADGAGFSGTQRLHEADLSSSRAAIWANTIELIAQHPLAGVGVGEFNFAWTLTAFPQRPSAFFDHSHNLPLQLLVELGLPLGGLTLALLAYALWRAFAAARVASGDAAVVLRGLFVMLLTMGVHSMVEYPLWYAYFLLPPAFAWGYCVGASTTAAPAATTRGIAVPAVVARAAGVVLVAWGALGLWDYRRVVAIFEPGPEPVSLAERIDAGMDSLYFGHHADYALVTLADKPGALLDAFERPVYYLLDTRLMSAWSKALAARGDVDRARWIAARLAEFRRPDVEPFFAPCRAPQGASKPFQCEPPQRSHGLEEFR